MQTIHTPETALAMMIDTNLSTHQYRKIREFATDISSPIYPPYSKIYQAKKDCYPAGIKITETSGEIPLQSLIEHTIHRICQTKNTVDILNKVEPDTAHIIFKWGCDGSTQKTYKQSFSDKDASDGNLFFISIVPIEMYCLNSNNDKLILWENTITSSTKYCRPIKFIFCKETTEVIRNEVENVNQQIAKLHPTILNINSNILQINSILILCMIDGKVCNSLSNYSSSQACYICGATPKIMNTPINFLSNKIDDKMLGLGISSLHAYIR